MRPGGHHFIVLEMSSICLNLRPVTLLLSVIGEKVCTSQEKKMKPLKAQLQAIITFANMFKSKSVLLVVEVNGTNFGYYSPVPELSFLPAPYRG